MEHKREDKARGEKMCVFFLEEESEDGVLIREQYTFVLDQMQIEVTYNSSETGSAPPIQDDWGAFVYRTFETEGGTREEVIDACKRRGWKEVSFEQVPRHAKVTCFVMRCLESSAFDIDGPTAFYDRFGLVNDLLHFV